MAISLVARQVGILTDNSSFFSVTTNPNFSKISLILLGGITTPNFFSKIFFGIKSGPVNREKCFSSITLLATDAPGQISKVMATAFCNAISHKLGSKDFSNRCALSERKFKRVEVLRTLTGLKLADSKIIVSVASVTPLFKAPISPFQAEDGIRDWSVTGVQTCALPI